MQYDFTSLMDRHGWDAIAVDGLGQPDGMTPAAPKPGFDAIPMWVADMNFPTVPTVPAAIAARAQHPAFGYFDPSEEYYDSIIRWQVQRHGADPALLTRDCIGYENGVLGGLLSAVGAFAPHRAFAAGAGRRRRLAHGLCGHGRQTQGEPHPCGGVLFAP